MKNPAKIISNLLLDDAERRRHNRNPSKLGGRGEGKVLRLNGRGKRVFPTTHCWEEQRLEKWGWGGGFGHLGGEMPPVRWHTSRVGNSEQGKAVIGRNGRSHLGKRTRRDIC